MPSLAVGERLGRRLFRVVPGLYGKAFSEASLVVSDGAASDLLLERPGWLESELESFRCLLLCDLGMLRAGGSSEVRLESSGGVAGDAWLDSSGSLALEPGACSGRSLEVVCIAFRVRMCCSLARRISVVQGGLQDIWRTIHSTSCRERLLCMAVAGISAPNAASVETRLA